MVATIITNAAVTADTITCSMMMDIYVIMLAYECDADDDTPVLLLLLLLLVVVFVVLSLVCGAMDAPVLVLRSAQK